MKTKPKLGLPDGLIARKGHGGREGEGLDVLGRAAAREQEAVRVVRWPMEYDCVLAHVFKCVCCNNVWPEEERREPESEVCVRCVWAAGLTN
jgi:hypothetical protein